MAPERLRLLFCDHLNLARGKYLPASKLGDGASRFSQAIFALTYAKDLVPAPGSKMLEGCADMDAVYRSADIRPGWEPGTQVVIADLCDSDGQPLGLCPRSLLKRTVAQWQELGWQPKVGLELEAFAFVRGADGTLRPYDTPGGYVYSTGRLADPNGFLDAIWARAEAVGFNLECMTSEFDSPQFEFTLVYDDALRAVDDAFLFRLMAREVALEHGIVLTFMPKPIPKKSGTGLHINFSFNDRAGRNQIATAPGIAGLSKLGRGCIAGLMRHHAGMAALVAPTSDSYNRLTPGSMSGYWCNWGIDHRGVTTRVSAQLGSKARIEHRMGDGSANPYTLVATVLQAARLGVCGDYPLPPPEAGDCFGKVDATDHTPADLSSALDALESDGALVGAVGELLVANLVAIKRAEVKETAGLTSEALRDYYIHYI